MSIKITNFAIENTKKVKTFAMELADKGLTIIGGSNGQGKSSVLDSIMWNLGGDKYKPANPVRNGADEVNILTNLNNGLTVTRCGKNGTLKVTDEAGKKYGQTLLNELIGQISLNIPRFMESNDKEKALILLEAFPAVATELERLTAILEQAYSERTIVGRDADRKKKSAEEMTLNAGVPSQTIPLTELLETRNEIDKRNREVLTARSSLKLQQEQAISESRSVDRLREELASCELAVKEKKATLTSKLEELTKIDRELGSEERLVEDMKEAPTEEVNMQIANAEEINDKVRENIRREEAKQDAVTLKTQYDELTESVENIRRDRIKLLSNVSFPMENLSISEGGELTYNGERWDGMGGAEQLRVATAVCKAVSPNCGFVLVDKLEQMDLNTLREFGVWLETQDLQIIATRVSDGDECTIIIEDGMVKQDDNNN